MPDTDPSLILHVPDNSARTYEILENQAHIEALPVDGIVVNIPASWYAMQPGYVATAEDVAEWLEPLEEFNEGMENYLLIVVDDPGPLDDDAAWANVVANIEVIAAGAEAAGFAGIVIDNEEYFGTFQDWDEADGSGLTLDEAEALAVQRGQEIGAAIEGAFPEATVMVMHGPYLSVPETAEALPAAEGQAGDWTGQELRGPFFTGIAEGLGPSNTMIDGGELYALRSDEEFAASFDYRDETMAELMDWPVDPALVEGWSEAIDQGHMVYTDEFPQGYDQTPESLVPTLLSALDHSEGMVVLYSDSDTVDWFDADGADAQWLAALGIAAELWENTQRADASGGVLRGGGAADRLIGEAGADRLSGAAGDDWLLGGEGRDVLRGGAGDDRLEGGAGRDLLAGGTGADTFVLSTGPGMDVIVDFDPAVDRIESLGGAVSLGAQTAAGQLVLVDGQATLILGAGPLVLDDILI